jgi:hypothetical protein
MVCGNFILPEIANRVSFFAYLNLRNLLYLIVVPSIPSNINHQVVIDAQAEHGTVQADKSTAASGEDVTLTVTPDEGYQMESLTVTDSKSNALPLTEEDGRYTFQMPDTAVTITATFAAARHDCTGEAFSDVDTDEWYHEAVDYALESGLMSGYGDGTFGPENDLTRAMLVQILYNREENPAVEVQLDFTDVPENAWYAQAVRWAVSEGIVEGYGNGRFGPNDKITRQDLAVMLWRYAGRPAPAQGTLDFTDADEVSGYAIEVLLWANKTASSAAREGVFSTPRAWPLAPRQPR